MLRLCFRSLACKPFFQRLLQPREAERMAKEPSGGGPTWPRVCCGGGFAKTSSPGSGGPGGGGGGVGEPHAQQNNNYLLSASV